MVNSIPLSIKQLSLSADKKKLFLSLSNHQEKITAIDIIDLIKTSIYKDLKINENSLNNAIKQLNNAGSSTNEEDKITPFIVAESLDAELFITINTSNMIAKANIISAFGGKKISTQQLIKAVDDLNIKVGINDAAIKLLIEKSAQAAPGTSYTITIAAGKRPIDGQDAYFSTLLKSSKDQLVKSIAEEYGSVDMNNIENIIAIKPGTPLIRKFPHRPGQDGLTITGKILPHRGGHDIPFHIGENTKICHSDPNLLISTAHGTAIPLDIGMKVEAVLIMDNVPKGAAPINHKGALIIKGDVPPGTNINATGDITVIGFIDSSEVTCGGDLFVSKGILSDRNAQRLNKCISKIECTGSLYSNFVQYSIIKTGKDLNLQCQLIHSTVFCDGYINVESKDHKKGTIFGGYLHAKKGIRTVILGARSGVQTTLDLNAYYLELIDNDKQAYSLINQVETKIQSMTEAQTKLNQLAGTEKTIQLLKRLRLTIADYKNRLVSFQAQRKENEDKIHRYFNHAQVNALKTIYSHVSISIGKKLLVTKQQYGATTIRIKSGKLIAESYRDNYKR